MTDKTQMMILKQMATCIASQFGSNCEVVIHSLDKKHHKSKIVHIENAHVSHRKQGDGPSPVVLETLKKDSKLLKDKLSYLTKAHDGRILKSSTLFIRDDNAEVTAIFAVNYDITQLIASQSALDSIIAIPADTEKKAPSIIPLNVSELLEDLIQEALKLIGKPVALMTKDDKIRAIQFLNNSGAFLVTKSGDKISKEFGISKYTMYSYMEAKGNDYIQSE